MISVDCKKKELVGDYANGGAEWEPEGSPTRVGTHDFPDPEAGKAIPYGVLDTGWPRSHGGGNGWAGPLFAGHVATLKMCTGAAGRDDRQEIICSTNRDTVARWPERSPSGSTTKRTTRCAPSRPAGSPSLRPFVSLSSEKSVIGGLARNWPQKWPSSKLTSRIDRKCWPSPS